MESAIKTVVSVFLKSSKGKENLGEKDFQSLVKNQLKNILSDTDSSEAVKKMRQGLDSDKDGKVSFQEYMKLIGYLAEQFSERRCNEETQALSSVQETSAEVPTVTKAEPKDGKQEEPVKVEVVAKVQEEEEVELEEGEKSDEVETEETS